MEGGGGRKVGCEYEGKTSETSAVRQLGFIVRSTGGKGWLVLMQYLIVIQWEARLGLLC